MQDIDFDELDRAVSSVMTTPDEETPRVVETPAPRLEVPARPAPTSPSPAVRRSSGRFMDVVHPSSDMRPQPVAARPAPVEDTAPEPVVEAPQPVEETPAPAPASDSFSWPDPIDMAAAELPEQSEPEAEALVVESTPTVEEDTTPLESPFLIDAKVDKRPLGAFSETLPPLDLSAILEDLPKDHDDSTPEETTTQDTPEVPAPSVEKLSGDDLEVSEEALIGANETSDTTPDVAPEPVALAAVKTTETALRDLEPTVPLGAASIPQQYAEQPASNDQPSGAIYDTEAYHQPLNHPHKKSSGWLVIIWIVGLIILGGGLGAALYFFVLPQL